jgi:hypothetical protein
VLPKAETVASAAQAIAAAEHIGFPVVLKVRSPDIVHKTEAGAVALDLRDPKAVGAAASALAARVQQKQPGARIEGFLVQEMVSGVEAIVGARNDPLYGPLLLVGTGGVLVELTNDASLRLLPVTRNEVEAVIEMLRLARLLAGFRGALPADRGALVTTVLALGRFFLDHRAKITDIEVNPLVVRASGCVAVDVRVLWL